MQTSGVRMTALLEHAASQLQEYFDPTSLSINLILQPFPGVVGIVLGFSQKDNHQIFESAMLKQVNSLLSQLVSYVKLKENKWFSLFLIQLPLIIVKLWVGNNQIHVSLYRTSAIFFH
ncbi:uncharacterized protein VP01_228g9 [Puccinia sorghi]|uniref:Uncharacterized protein n=1 Tax=Puccinia sorghi TaxID=27349 RepID=A0A0L6V7Y8_9BASI|nr:uncharacterized protein VP01_228g9 [Puccinia sorghi]